MGNLSVILSGITLLIVGMVFVYIGTTFDNLASFGFFFGGLILGIGLGIYVIYKGIDD